MYGVDGVLYIVAETPDSRARQTGFQILGLPLSEERLLSLTKPQVFPLFVSHSRGYSHLIERTERVK